MKKILNILLFLVCSMITFGQSHFGSKTFSKPTLSALDIHASSSTSIYTESYVVSNGGATINAYRILLDDVNPPIDTVLYSPLNANIYSWLPFPIHNSQSGLTQGVTYYCKICASNVAGETCTSVSSFTLPATANSAPSVSTTAATSIGTTTATLNGEVTSDGGASVTDRGFYYSLTNPPSTNVTSGTGTGAFNTPLTGLSTAQTYYYRAYATNSVGTKYGDITSFTLTAPSGTPSVTTTTATNITTNVAVAGGNVVHDGNSAILGRGVCYSTSASVDTADFKAIVGGTTGSFVVYLPNLNSNTTYYYRAYAYNVNGVTYGTEYNFTTNNTAGLATVTTATPTSVTTGSAVLGGNVTSDGGSTVTAKGVCYSIYPNPTIGSPGGTGTGAFTVPVSYLTQGTTYYCRAYAVNSVGTAYGSQLTFTTLNPSTVPEVTTLAATQITTTTAIAGGQITYNGNSGITELGLCYSTSTTPTINNNKVVSNVYNYFNAMLASLTPNTTYYYRAYAINGIGVGYGSILSFTTSVSLSLPTVTTTAINSIAIRTASGGGDVSDDGGSTVTKRGLVWNKTGNPSLLSYTGVTTNGTGEGTFTSSLTGLQCGTTYYVRAYATNSVGTAYSADDVVFITLKPTISYDLYYMVTDHDGNVFTCGNNKPEVTLSQVRNFANGFGNPPIPNYFAISQYSIESCTGSACVVVGTIIYGKNSCSKTIATGYYYYAPSGLVISYPFPVYIIHLTNGVVDFVQEWYPD